MQKHVVPKISILGKLFLYSTEFFHKRGFVQLAPVILGKSVDPLGPDPGSSIEKIPEIEYQGQKLRLITSMILHKQLALKDFPKIFILSPNVRLERKERYATAKHLFEFTQVDFEVREAKMKDIIGLIEEYYKMLTPFLKKSAKEEFEALGIEIFKFKPPFKVYTTMELKEKYGDDWEKEASIAHKQPFWAISHKREFYDKESETKPGFYLNYDLIYPFGFGEALSGAEREYKYERIVMRIKRDRLPLEHYKPYLEFAKRGFYPSAGAGIGLERLARFLTQAAHIEEVSYFKRVPGKPVIL